MPPWEAAALPARLRSKVGAPSLELELSPGFTAYQDGFSRLIASDTTFVTGLAALAGLDGWPSPKPRADAAFAALFTPAEQAAWQRPDALAVSVPALAETVARLVRAGGRVGVGSDSPAVPYGLGVHLELALLAKPASRTTKSCAWRPPKALSPSASSGTSALSRKARSPTSSSWTGTPDADRRYPAHRRRRERGHLARPSVPADAAMTLSGVFTTGIVAAPSNAAAPQNLRAFAKQPLTRHGSLSTRA